jgi:hypothetical protein
VEHAQARNDNHEHLGVILIVRDILIFSMLLMAAALIYVIVPRMQRTAVSDYGNDTMSESAVETVQVEPPQAEEQLPAGGKDDTPEPEQTEEPTPTPAAEQETETRDFSSFFPTDDTGAGAILSYQSDTLRIAIREERTNGATYFIADVWVKSIDELRTAFAKGTYGRGILEMPLKITQENDSVFAVSGDYYGAREDGVVVRNGVLYRDVMSDDVCILRRDGMLQAYRKGEFSALEMLNDTVWQAWAFGPALVENGVVCDTSSSRIKVKNPRCAIGYYEPGHYCFIVVDGRQSGYSEGMTLDELAQVFAFLGCKAAYNLDGGATAMMVFDGAVVNHPTNGGRSSSDIIFF